MRDAAAATAAAARIAASPSASARSTARAASLASFPLASSGTATATVPSALAFAVAPLGSSTLPYANARTLPTTPSAVTFAGSTARTLVAALPSESVTSVSSPRAPSATYPSEYDSAPPPPHPEVEMVNSVRSASPLAGETRTTPGTGGPTTRNGAALAHPSVATPSCLTASVNTYVSPGINTPGRITSELASVGVAKSRRRVKSRGGSLRHENANAPVPATRSAAPRRRTRAVLDTADASRSSSVTVGMASRTGSTVVVKFAARPAALVNVTVNAYRSPMRRCAPKSAVFARPSGPSDASASAASTSSPHAAPGSSARAHAHANAFASDPSGSRESDASRMNAAPFWIRRGPPPPLMTATGGVRVTVTSTSVELSPPPAPANRATTRNRYGSARARRQKGGIVSDRRVARGARTNPSYASLRSSEKRHGAAPVRFAHAYVSALESAAHADPGDASAALGSRTSIPTTSASAWRVSSPPASPPAVGKIPGTFPATRSTRRSAVDLDPSHVAIVAANAYEVPAEVADAGISRRRSFASEAARTSAASAARPAESASSSGSAGGMGSTSAQVTIASHPPSARAASSASGWHSPTLRGPATVAVASDELEPEPVEPVESGEPGAPPTRTETDGSIANPDPYSNHASGSFHASARSSGEPGVASLRARHAAQSPLSRASGRVARRRRGESHRSSLRGPKTASASAENTVSGRSRTGDPDDPASAIARSPNGTSRSKSNVNTPVFRSSAPSDATTAPTTYRRVAGVGSTRYGASPGAASSSASNACASTRYTPLLLG